MRRLVVVEVDVNWSSHNGKHSCHHVTPPPPSSLAPPLSAMRLMSVIALIASIAFGVLSLLGPATDNPNALYITTAFLIAAFAPKALQKFAEARFS